jgi:transposase
MEQVALGGGERARELVGELLERLERVAVLREQVAVLSAKIEELERRASRDSGNSSMPPSSDPPLSRAERRRRAREAYKRSMRHSGGQAGHEGSTREMVAGERVDHRVEHLPERCGCGHQFTGGEARLGEPVVHQQWELPAIRPLVFEYARVRLACPGCGRAVLAELPGLALSGYGPRLQAQIAMLAGVFRLSREQVRQVVVEVFAVPACTGTIDRVLMRVGRVLADPWQELRHAVRQAQAVHMDETSWSQAGTQQWLWVAASALAACYRIDPARSQRACKELIGADFAGILVTDRYAGYHWLDVLQQQLCWCHLIRQLTEVSQRSGPPGRLGEQLLIAARTVIKTYHEHLAGTGTLEDLQEQIDPLRDQIRGLLIDLGRCGHPRSERFAAGLLAEYPALWTFCFDDQVDPTNNAGERAMRHTVLLRRIQNGTQSDPGNRWIERISSIRETCRLQSRPVLDYLTSAMTAAQLGQPIPTLAAADP